MTETIGRSRSAIRKPKAAMTFIEVLVSIAIILMLMALLFPAVQAARESGRRLQCSNRLRQIGIGLHSYLDANGCFPAINAPSTTLPNQPSVPLSAHSYSPLVRILPYLERADVYDLVNFNFQSASNISLHLNETVMLARIDLFVCPSDGGPSISGYGRSNYRFCHGPTPAWSPWAESPLTFAGPFSVHRFYRAQDFSRGLSHVVGASERIQGDWELGSFGWGDYTLSPPPYYSGDDGSADSVIEHCRSLPADSRHESRGGESWFQSGNHFTCYNHVMTPNSVFRDCALEDITEGVHERTLHSGMFSARSFHGSGVNTLSMDGHCEFVDGVIDRLVWRTAATRLE